MGCVYDFIVNTADAAMAVDHHQNVVLWNEAASGALGFSPEEVRGKPCYGFLRGRDSAGCTVCRRDCDAITAARRHELPTTTDLVARTKQGDEVWLNVSTVVVPSSRPELSVLVHLFRDVTRSHDLKNAADRFTDIVSELSSARRTGRHSIGAVRSACADLTHREREVLGQLATGLATTTIADRLCISRHTVRNHVSNILDKLGVHSRLEAVTYSIRNGLV